MLHQTWQKSLAAGLTVLGVLLSASAAYSAEKTLRVYHVGNSVTDTINYNGLRQLAQSRGNTYIFGRHMIPGAPLSWIWEHPHSGFREEPFGYYPQALPNYQWDVLTIQPFDRNLEGKDGDIAMAKNYIDLALPKSPDIRVYIYSRWPRKDKDGSLNFNNKWLRKQTGGWDGTQETRDYFEKLTRELRSAYPKLQNRIFLVPVGDVLLELDQRMRAGKVAGYNSITQVYSDGIHFNEVGSYIVGCTFYTTLYKNSPRGLTASPYKVNNPALVKVIHDAIWKVVKAHPLSGVAAARLKKTQQETPMPLMPRRLIRSSPCHP